MQHYLAMDTQPQLRRTALDTALGSNRGQQGRSAINMWPASICLGEARWLTVWVHSMGTQYGYTVWVQHSSFSTHNSSFIIHSTHHSALIIQHSPFSAHHSSFSIHHSASIIHHSSFSTHHPGLIIHSTQHSQHSSFSTHHSALIIHHSASIIHHASFRARTLKP